MSQCLTQSSAAKLIHDLSTEAIDKTTNWVFSVPLKLIFSILNTTFSICCRYYHDGNNNKYLSTNSPN